MKRSCRHSVYIDEPDIRHAMFSVGTYNGDDIYLHLKKQVAASYHRKANKKFYWTEVACNSESLLYTQCNCKAGANDNLPCSVNGPCGDHKIDHHTDIHNMVA